MRRALLCVVALAIVASTAMAVPSLVAIPKITSANPGNVGGVGVQVGTYPRGITPDGRFVGGVAGRGYSSGGVDTGFAYDAATGISGEVIAGGYNETVDGIGYWTDGTTTKVVVEGSNSGYQSMNAWNTATDWNGTAQWAKVRRTGTAYYGNGQNRMAGNSVGGLLHGVYQTGAQNNLYIDSFNGTTYVATPDTKSVTNDTTLNGISNAGKVVGIRGNQNYSMTYTGAGGVSGAAFVNASPDGSANGNLYDIADDGSIMGGYGAVTGKTGWYAFVYNGTTPYELPNLGGPTTGLATNSCVYSISPDGKYAVGMDYSYGMELAVMWDLHDLGNITALNLTQFATSKGILDGFTGNLRRGTAIGINGDGDPVIAGVGVNSALEANGWTAFVMTVPEPTTALFLALGGVALLRRRTR